MNFIIEEFDKYKVFLYAGNVNYVASVHIPLPSGKAVLRFYEGELHENAAIVSGDRTLYKVNINSDLLHNYIDILRNEKPLFFYFDMTSKLSYLTTSDEPVGEGEDH